MHRYEDRQRQKLPKTNRQKWFMFDIPMVICNHAIQSYLCEIMEFSR